MLAVAATSCNRSGVGETPASSTTVSEAEDLSIGPTGWVKLYDPRRAWNGYTLTLHNGRRPVLIDMNGRSVHSWPGARVKSRVKLLEDGSLLGLALGRSVVEYDWEGNLVWRFDVSPDLPHHDVIRLENGNTLFPVLPDGGGADDIFEVNRAGEIVWRWSAIDHLSEHISKRQARQSKDITHINSVQEIQENKWFEGGDERFRPGNILVSSRNLNRIFIIDKASKAVVWSYTENLDLQHEAQMIPRGYPHEGNILLFDNGFRNTYRYRKSRILEIDPLKNAVVWEYVSDDLFSPTAGVQQPLANGNILVGSSRGERIFEINREGTILWQWAPPFEPVRPARYAHDHCPQLAALGTPRPTPVRPPPGYRHVDPPVYEFVSKAQQRRSRLERTVQTVLADNNDCHEVLLPSEPALWVSYGVSRKAVVLAGRDEYAASFGLRFRSRGAADWVQLFQDTVDLDSRRWRVQELPLDEYALQWIELCVETREVGASAEEPTEAYAFWNGPKITPRNAPQEAASDDQPADDLTAEELEVQRQHLKALGYVN